jgi:predicted transposase YdaD
VVVLGLGMKTDKLFYKMLLRQPGAVAELVPEGFEYEYKAVVEGILSIKFPELTIDEVRQMLGLKSVDITETKFFQEASQIGEAKSTLRQLAVQCGDLSIAQQEQVRSLSAEQLERLSTALLRFTGMGDLEGWLEQNGQNEG